MKITIDRLNEAVHLKATNEDGRSIEMDGSESIGGQGKGPRPMQVLMMSLGGCSTMDVLSILKKMKQEITSYRVELNGEREPDVVPSLFTDIHVTYFVEGSDLNPERVKHAVDLSMGKYCSVTRILEKTANITWEVRVNGELA